MANLENPFNIANIKFTVDNQYFSIKTSAPTDINKYMHLYLYFVYKHNIFNSACTCFKFSNLFIKVFSPI